MHFRSLFCAIALVISGLPQSAISADEDEIGDFYQEVVSFLAAQPRPTFPIEAEALIAFTIADDGSIAEASVAQSSGSDPLDAAALALVRSAAPFPTPPEGANRNLSITIKATRPVLSFGSFE